MDLWRASTARLCEHERLRHQSSGVAFDVDIHACCSADGLASEGLRMECLRPSSGSMMTEDRREGNLVSSLQALAS